MDELVNMLRGMALGPTNWPPKTWQTYANMAADEIERLQFRPLSLEVGRLQTEIERLRAAMTELHRIADSGESDIRAIGLVIDRFPELRSASSAPAVQTCKHGTLPADHRPCPECFPATVDGGK